MVRYQQYRRWIFVQEILKEVMVTFEGVNYFENLTKRKFDYTGEMEKTNVKFNVKEVYCKRKCEKKATETERK